MKKYSSYFNKRYFPEQEEKEEAPLSGEAVAQEDESSAQEHAPIAVPDLPVGMPAAKPSSAFSFRSLDMPEEEPLSAMGQEEEPMMEQQSAPEITPAAPVFEMPSEPVSQADTETTVISESAVISGEISVSGNIKMYGKIKGNMTATGNLEIRGKVIGNLAGNDVELNRCELKGDITATGFTFMDKESIMIGNLQSADITLDGKVKGDVTAEHKVYVRSNAVIVGNVRAAVIAIDEGAALQGQVIIANKENDGLNINSEEN